jgi:hypothetical protein
MPRQRQSACGIAGRAACVLEFLDALQRCAELLVEGVTNLAARVINQPILLWSSAS